MKHHEVVKQAFRVLVGLVAVAATLVLLVADSAEKCPHKSHAVAFDVSGTCGPPGLVMLAFSTSDNSCLVEGYGLDEVGLPTKVVVQAEPNGQEVWLGRGRFAFVGEVDPVLRRTDAGAPGEDGGPGACDGSSDAGASDCHPAQDAGVCDCPCADAGPPPGPLVACRRIDDDAELRFHCVYASEYYDRLSAMGPYCEAVFTPR